MANIYIKVPTYVAQFYRNRDIDNKLSEFQPVEFSKFQQESAIMAASIMLVPEQDMEHTMCFSQRMWNNILSGKKPQGGKIMIKRDPQQWPTIDEVCFIANIQRNKRTDGLDYLCIAAPKAIAIGGRYKQVTTSFTLPLQQANEMAKYLRREFIRILLNWIRNEMALCDIRGIKRDIAMCVDHFFYHYGMCLGTNGTDRESMRRMATRWMKESKMMADDIEDEDVLFEYEKEQKKAMPIDVLLDEMKAKNVKPHVNK